MCKLTSYRAKLRPSSSNGVAGTTRERRDEEGSDDGDPEVAGWRDYLRLAVMVSVKIGSEKLTTNNTESCASPS